MNIAIVFSASLFQFQLFHATGMVISSRYIVAPHLLLLLMLQKRTLGTRLMVA